MKNPTFAVWLFKAITYFTCKRRATQPAARGADDEVPLNSSVHAFFKSVVICCQEKRDYYSGDLDSLNSHWKRENNSRVRDHEYSKNCSFFYEIVLLKLLKLQLFGIQTIEILILE